MKKANRILLLVFCMLFFVLIGSASAQKCICYDENGNPYDENLPGDTFCYQYMDGSLVMSQSLTLQQCQAINAAQAEKEAEEAARRQREAEEAARRQQEAEEAARRQREAEEAARRQQEAEEAARSQQEAEEAARRQQEAEEAARRQQEAEEAARRQQEAEEAARRQQEAEEAARRQQEAEEAARRQQEAEEAARIQQEAEEAARIQQEAEEAARRQQEAEEAARIQQEAEEAARIQQEAEEAARIQQEAEEATRIQQEAEEAARIQQEAEEAARRQQEAEDAARNQQGSEDAAGNEKQIEEPAVGAVQTEEPADDVKQTEEPVVDADQTEEPVDDVKQTEEPVVGADQTEEPIDDVKQTEEPTEEVTETEEPTEEVTETEEPTEEVTETEEPTEEVTETEEPTEEVKETVEPTEEVKETVEPTEEVKETEEPTEDVKETEEPPKKGPGIPIEGKLTDIGLSSPAGETFKTAAVPFTWVYTVSDSSPIEVEFELTLNIDNLENGQNTTSTTVVSSASCSNFICTYTAGGELSGFKKANVTWTVSGTYDDGGSSVTINSNPASRSFKLNVKEPVPTATPTPTSTPKPTKTPKPTATPKPTKTPKPTATPMPKPKAPVQECPIGRYIVRSLGFYWAPSKYATSYTVKWHNDRGQEGTLKLSNSDQTCKNGRCIVYGSMPGIGKYAWTVTAENKSGSATSGEMRFEIASNISIPTAYSPNGTIVNRYFPEFQWEDVRDGAIAYRIQVVGKYDNRIRMDRWFDVKDIYVGNGICYVKTDLFLPAGTYCWRVQARNKDFPSGWSSWLDFYVECDYCNYQHVNYKPYTNTVPRTSYPAGIITSLSPEFQWQTLTGASYYIVKAVNSSGTQMFERQVSSSNCTLELCTYNPQFKFPSNGVYTWTVSGYGANGGYWGSASGSFEIRAEIVMKPISFVSPEQNGYLNQDTPVIIWTDPGETTALFNVEIYDKNNNLLLNADLNREQAWCDGITCSIAFQSIPDAENYRIAITQYSELNTKGGSIELVFSKGMKPIALKSPKEGSVVQPRPMFRWALEAGETAEYQLTLIDDEGNETVYGPLVCGIDGVNCEEGEAFFSPADMLAPGNYTAGLGIAGVGIANNSGITFTVE